MAKEKLTIDQIMELADIYGVKNNVLFVSASKRYAAQLQMLEKIQKQIEEDGLMVEHVTSTGASNMEANPLVCQIPKYNDTANKTLGVMLDIFAKLGKPAPAGDKLGEFLNE